jgi:hypothetical protein
MSHEKKRERKRRSLSTSSQSQRSAAGEKKSSSSHSNIGGYPSSAPKTSRFGFFGRLNHLTDHGGVNEYASDEEVSSTDEEEEEESSGQKGGSGRNGGSGEQEVDNKEDAKALAKRELVGMVEVAWRGKTQRVCFPMPLEAHNLTEKTKRTFLDKTRLYTTDKRLELLFQSSDLFIAEMDWVYSLAERSRMYRVIGRYFGSLRLLMYSLVVLLNVNVLMSPPSLSHPIHAMFGDGNYAALDSNERLSLLITFSLGLLNFVGYFGELIYFKDKTVC